MPFLPGESSAMRKVTRRSGTSSKRQTPPPVVVVSRSRRRHEKRKSAFSVDSKSASDYGHYHPIYPPCCGVIRLYLINVVASSVRYSQVRGVGWTVGWKCALVSSENSYWIKYRCIEGYFKASFFPAALFHWNKLVTKVQFYFVRIVLFRDKTTEYYFFVSFIIIYLTHFWKPSIDKIDIQYR